MFLLYPLQFELRAPGFAASTEWQRRSFSPTRTHALMTEKANATIRIPPVQGALTRLYFHRHRWSGLVRVVAGNNEKVYSLFSPEPQDFYAIDVTDDSCEILVECLGAPANGSLSTEVWFIAAAYSLRPSFFPVASRLDLGGVGYSEQYITVNLAPNCNICCDIRDLDLIQGGARLDECRLSHTLEHIQADQIWYFLRQIFKRLSHNGKLTIVQTDAGHAIRQWAGGELSFASLRNVLFAPPQAVRGDRNMTHHYMWSEASLNSDLIAIGFWPEPFDAGGWPFDVSDELRPEESRQDIGKHIKNLGIVGTKLSGQDHTGKCYIDSDLKKYGKKVFSQNDEDGVLLHLLAALDIEGGTFVEIGIARQPEHKAAKFSFGYECNCWILFERGWSGLWIDSLPLPDEVPHVQTRITPSTINSVLEEHLSGKQIDVFSLDIDGQDYFVWKALRQQPKIVIIEYNASIGYGLKQSVLPDDNFDWDGTNYFGASFSALDDLGRSKGYTCVYANGVNMFFVRSELLRNQSDFSPALVYRYARIHPEPTPRRVWLEVKA